MATRRKRSSPALYELIKPRTTGAAIDTPPPVEEGGGGERGGWLAPGRALSMPVGYVLLAIGVVGLLLPLAYSVGFSRGHAEGEDSVRADIKEEFVAAAQPRPRDPLTVDRAVDDGGRAAPGTKGVLGMPESRVVPPPAGVTPPRPDSRGWGPVEPVAADGSRDPRQPGHRYLVLMETTRDGAIRLAEYCRQRGLETYVVPSHNKQHRRLVVAFPGFPAAVRTTSPEFKTLRRRVEDIGDSWKRNEGGATDLHDAYPLQYNPGST